MSAKENEQQLNKTIRDLLRQLYEIETIAGDFTQPNSQDLLVARLQELQQGLQQLRDRTAAFKGTQVPTQLLEYIDNGGHPEDFVRLSFKQAVQQNQLAAGRVAAIAALRDELLTQAKEAFPQDAAIYKWRVSPEMMRYPHVTSDSQLRMITVSTPPEDVD